MRPERLNALTDGVVAIVLTIMVLELKFPEEPTFAAVFAVMPSAIPFAMRGSAAAIRPVGIAQRISAYIM